jgi:hypothetical protein
MNRRSLFASIAGLFAAKKAAAAPESRSLYQIHLDLHLEMMKREKIRSAIMLASNPPSASSPVSPR